jgi:STE24 endopeptidase
MIRSARLLPGLGVLLFLAGTPAAAAPEPQQPAGQQGASQAAPAGGAAQGAAAANGAAAAASGAAAAASGSAPAAPAVITEYQPPPDKYARAVEYSRAHYDHYFVDAAYGLLVLLLLLFWGVGPRYRDWAERASRRRSLQVLVYAPLLLLTVGVLGLPSDAWDQALSRRFGLSVQGWGSWSLDWLMNQVIVLAVGTLLVRILYGVVRRSPRRWWLYFWLASIPVLILAVFGAPLVIEPLFYTFKPLAPGHPALVSEIERVTQRGGMEIPPDRMFEMNASSKQTGLNAYVSGFGASKRVVVWDNTMAKATIPETLFVFGHEMGHYVLHHIPQELALDAGILLVLLYLGYRLAVWMVARWGPSWGIRGIDDWASLPIVLFVLSLLTFLASPAFNTISRHFEHEADRYGLEVIHGIVPNQGQVAAHYFEKSGEINLADPDPSPFMKVWFFDHPPRRERTHFAATYDPWSSGESPRYVK